MNKDEVALIKSFWKRMIYFNKYKEGKYVMFTTRKVNMNSYLKDLLEELKCKNIKNIIKKYKIAGF